MSAPTLAELGIGLLFDVVPDAIVVGDMTEGRVVAWNVAATAMFGYDRDDAMGLAIEVLVPAELREAHLAGLARYAAGAGGHLTGSSSLVELPALRADGSRLWVELRLAPLATTSGDRRYVVAVFRDATARRRAQAEAASAFEETKAANASLRDFVAMAAHDIRAPVSAISMAMDLLARHGDRLDDSQRSTILDGARRHTAFVSGLLEDLLDVSSIEAGELAGAPDSLVVDEVVAGAVETAGVECQVDVPTDLTVYADRGHLQRAITNLLGNAQKYARPPIVVRAQQRGRFVAVSVDDNGDGIEPQLQSRMFDKFARGPATAASKPGAGLGLAIVAGLARANGGDVAYQQLPGGGSSFTTTWPTTSPASATPRQRDDAP
ncbi:MAG: hypothetical protein NVS3B26_07330 [Mycobacteriales bacterium]